VLLLSPPGYGKTTLLRQWDAADPRPFFWVPAADRDSSERIADGILAMLRRRWPDAQDADASGDPVRALARLLVDPPEPFVLVFDDVTRSRGGGTPALDAIASLPVSAAARVAYSGRSLDDSTLTELHLNGRVERIGEADLRLDIDEAERMVGDVFDRVEVDDILRLTEGWAAGIRLAWAAGREGAASSFSGRDRLMIEYVRTKVLPHDQPELAEFLMQCAIFPDVSAGLCDHILGRTDSQTRLELAERSGLFLFARTREAESFRWHGLVREALADEFDRRDSEQVRRLRRAGSDWLATHGGSREALRLRIEDDDRADAPRLLREAVLPMFYSGELSPLVDLIHAIGADIATSNGYLATMFAYAGMMTGDDVCAVRWGRVATQHYRSHPFESSDEAAAYLTFRAHLSPSGVAGMLDDALAARRTVDASSVWLPPVLMLCGTALSLSGRREEATRALDEAIHVSREFDAGPALVLALAERGQLADAAGENATQWIDEAAELARDVRFGTYPQAALGLALSAVLQTRGGDQDAARSTLAAAHRFRPLLGRAIPWLGLQLRHSLARASISLGDAAGARAVLAEARTLLPFAPDMKAMQRAIDDLDTDAASLGVGRTGGSSLLTSAEWRLLPLLPTHLSFEEIGERLHLSKNTIKTQAISIYRKLGVTSRSEAVASGQRLGLIDADLTTAHS
jgi:LuxR family transcriptional regulator, maltose regulon positive regulatory protein